MNEGEDLEFEDPVVVFDGKCNLCSGVVKFILDHEQSARLKFAPLSSEAGLSILNSCGMNPENPESFVLYENGNAYRRSEAAIRILKYLEAPLPLIASLLGLVPRSLRDRIYVLISNNRHKFFGSKDVCMKPPNDYTGRFLG